MAAFRLEQTAGGRALVDTASGESLHIDFASPRLRHRLKGGGRELLARAARAKPGLRVLDATAGLGTDAFVLAARGCEVLLVERSHTLYLLLEDALARARASGPSRDIALRMSLVRGDASYIMAGLGAAPDVVVIDPMFPPRRKSAAVRGELRLLQRFAGKDEDARGLLVAARAAGAKRIVVKRPPNGGDIAGFAPAFTVRGKALRFDVF